MKALLRWAQSIFWAYNATRFTGTLIHVMQLSIGTSLPVGSFGL
jgi:hypothetical protein